MGKGRPLFEILQEQKAQNGGTLNFNAPKPKSPEHQEIRQELRQEPVKQPAAEVPRVRESADDDDAGFDLQAIVRWIKDPVAWNLPRGAVGGAVALLLVVVGVSFVVGQWMGEQSTASDNQDYHAATAPLLELQNDPSQDLIPSTVNGVEPHNARFAMGDGEGNGVDPRIDALNYFRLIVVPSSAGEEIYRIVDFLKDHEVDAAVVPINNGRSLKVVALPGFERPRSDPRALELRERLKVLGRKWRTEYDGSTDWNDLMAEKYRPGVN